MSRTVLCLGTLFVLTGDCSPAFADFTIGDPAGDILSTYTGPTGADLDVLRAGVNFTGQQFQFRATLAGPVGTTAGAFYVFGLDTGRGTARFGAFAPNVLFDSVVILRPNGTGQITDIIGASTTILTPASISISGNTISADFSASLLSSRAVTPDRYTWNLWPRVGAGSNAQITDFAPDNDNAPVTTSPAPASAFLLAFGAIGIAFRRARKQPVG